MLPRDQQAPDFKLPLFGGGEIQYYRDTVGHSVLIFYKFSCPTCRLALPFLQTLYETYGRDVGFIAIAQDGPEKTEWFLQEFRITIPTAMDLPPYTASDAYAVQIVPSVFLVNTARRIVTATEGFVKQELADLAARLAKESTAAQIDLFAGMEVPELKPG